KAGEFAMSYHENPRPEQALKFLDKLVDEKVLAGLGEMGGRGDVVASHCFGHMARGQTKLIRAYEAQFPKAGKRGREFLLTSLQLCGDETTAKTLDAWSKDIAFKDQKQQIDRVSRFLADPKRKLPRDTPPVESTDLDLLWADFMVTGEYA